MHCRLKSVACLPWKFFMYKALNTFIDDLFAFIIKMPTLHRMSCFRGKMLTPTPTPAPHDQPQPYSHPRACPAADDSTWTDDIVFIVFLYQRWVYRVDMTRVNEFGHRGDGGKDEKEKGKESKKRR